MSFSEQFTNDRIHEKVIAEMKVELEQAREEVAIQQATVANLEDVIQEMRAEIEDLQDYIKDLEYEVNMPGPALRNDWK